MKKYIKATKVEASKKYIKTTVEVSDDPTEVIDLSDDPDDTVYSVDSFDDYMEFMNRYKL